LDHRFTALLTTPVFHETVRIATHSSDLRREVVQVSTRRGRVLASAEVAIPPGMSEIDVVADPRWPDHVVVTLGEVLTADAIKTEF
jgi:hypothetical protein